MLIGKVCAVTAAVAAATILSGCGSGDEAPEQRVRHFQAALQADDARAACADLAEQTRQALEEQEQRPCHEVIGDQGVPGGAGPAEVRRYGSMAQVRGNGDVLFLSRYSDGWRVVAAGCTPAGGDEPYDCALEVG